MGILEIPFWSMYALIFKKTLCFRLNFVLVSALVKSQITDNYEGVEKDKDSGHFTFAANETGNKPHKFWQVNLGNSQRHP